MIRFILCLCILAFSVAIQAQDLEVPVFPSIPSPTPFMTPTPVYSLSGGETNLINIATTEVAAEEPLGGITVQSQRVYWNGKPLLPAIDQFNEFFNFAKWLTSSGAEGVFGIFSPVMIHLSVLITVATTAVVIHYSQIIAQTLIKFVKFIFEWVMKLFGAG